MGQSWFLGLRERERERELGGEIEGEDGGNPLVNQTNN